MYRRYCIHDINIDILVGCFFLIWIKPCYSPINQRQGNYKWRYWRHHTDGDNIDIDIDHHCLHQRLDVDSNSTNAKTHLMTLIQWYKEELIFYLLTIVKAKWTFTSFFMTIQHSYKCWPWWIDIKVRTPDMCDVSTTTLVDMYWL